MRVGAFFALLSTVTTQGKRELRPKTRHADERARPSNPSTSQPARAEHACVGSHCQPPSHISCGSVAGRSAHRHAVSDAARLSRHPGISRSVRAHDAAVSDAAMLRHVAARRRAVSGGRGIRATARLEAAARRCCSPGDIGPAHRDTRGVSAPRPADRPRRGIRPSADVDPRRGATRRAR